MQAPSSIRRPKPGDKLFKHVGSGPLSHVDAQIHWPVQVGGDDAIGEAYYEAAELLAEHIKRGGDGTPPDRFFFPIAYLYRHCLELRLKMLVRLGLALEVFPNDRAIQRILRDHKLMPLWNKAKATIERHCGGSNKDTQVIESLINELHQFDKAGQALRYAATKNGKPALPPAPQIVDLASFQNVFSGLIHYINGSIDMLDDLRRAAT